jgi:hypothetical protein
MLIQALQSYITAFAQMVLASTFGLAMSISIAGISHVESPFGCRTCAPISQKAPQSA